MPKKATLVERIEWYKEHAIHCAYRSIPQSSQLAMGGEKPINHYFLDSQFLKFYVSKYWLKQEGTDGRETRWYTTTKGKVILKEKFGIEI